MAITKFLKKLLLFLGLISLIQIGIYHFSFKRISEFEQTLAQKPEVLLFGSSVEQHIAPNDQDDRRLYQLLKDTLQPERKVGVISGGAFHLELFEAYINRLLEEGKFEGKLIIPINLRSFSPEWHKRPEYQFELEKLILRKGRYWGGFLATLAVFKYQYTQNIIPPAEFQDTPVKLGHQVVGTVAELTDEINTSPERFMKEGFLLSYLAYLDRRHGKVQAFERICRKLKAQQVKAFFYFTPIDAEKGGQYYPKQFTKIVNANIQLLERVAQERGYTIANFAYLAPSEMFDYSIRANEHLNEAGKKCLAQALAEYYQKTLD